jgi:CubicO group peptidase (beta-lactamase class C family)
MKTQQIKQALLLTQFFVLILACTAAYAQALSGALNKKADSLYSRYNDKSHPGVSLLVMKDGKTILSKNYGSANVEKADPVSNNTQFHIASLTKQFTAYAISKLESEGKLAYNDDIKKYLPGIPDFGSPVTIDQLLHHTAGLRSTNRLRLLQDRFYDRELTQENALGLIYAQKELNFPPGSDFGYSNSGYILLATIVENISKMKFADWLTKNIFKPLDMQSSYLVAENKKLPAKLALPYEEKDGTFKTTWAMLWLDYGASGIYSTLNDLAKWQLFIVQQKQMLRQGKLNNGATIPYAMGLYISGKNPGDADLVEHTGDGGGYTSVLSHYTKENIDLVLLSNIYSGEPIELTKQLAQLWLGNNNDQKKPGESLKLPAEVLDKYDGVYDIGGMPCRFEHKDGILFAHNPANPGQVDALTATDDKTFKLIGGGMEVIFSFSKDGESMVMDMGGNSMSGPKMAEPKKAEQKTAVVKGLDHYTGKYYSPEIESAFELVVEDGFLVAYSPMKRRIVLTPETAEKFTSNDRYFRNISFIKNNEGSMGGIRVTDIDGRVRNLWFKKVIE